MRIGVISDTHLTARATKLPDALVQGLKGVDLILHAGDWVNLEIVDMVEEIAPCDSVAGNNDGPEIIERFGRAKLLELAGYRIGLVHGDGFRKTTAERAREIFAAVRPDIVIFGHSHIPYHQTVEGVLLFNPVRQPTKEDSRSIPSASSSWTKQYRLGFIITIVRRNGTSTAPDHSGGI